MYKSFTHRRILKGSCQFSCGCFGVFTIQAKQNAATCIIKDAPDDKTLSGVDKNDEADTRSLSDRSNEEEDSTMRHIVNNTEHESPIGKYVGKSTSNKNYTYQILYIVWG